MPRLTMLIRASAALLAVVAIVALVAVARYDVVRHRCDARGGEWVGQFPTGWSCDGGIPADRARCHGGLAFYRGGGLFSGEVRLPEWDSFCQGEAT